MICKDIQYKDAIIDVLNENNNIDIIFINENIPGDISDEKLIKLIKENNEKIKIIYILEKQNKNKEIFLKEKNIYDIYYNEDININKIIEIINNKSNYQQLNSEEENNNEINNLIIKNNNIKNKIITISGPANVGKTNFIINLFKIIKNKKILIIDFDINKQNIYTFLGIEKNSEIINNLISQNYNSENKFNLNNYIIKLNNNKFLISGLDLLSYFFNQNNEEKLNAFFQIFLNNIKNNYDLILFDIGSENNKKINKIIFKKSDFNILLMEGNLIGINKLKKYIENNNYIKEPNLIINKKDNYCIDKNIIKRFFNYNILGEIKYKKIYSNLINRNYNYFYNLKNGLKKEYVKIYNNLNVNNNENKNNNIKIKKIIHAFLKRT